jgi:hypothetical protein
VIRYERVTFHAPARWGIQPGDHFALVGVLAGGRQDVNLRVETGVGDPIDSFQPTACFLQGRPPEKPVSVEQAQSGFAPVGDRTAEFRLWRVTCPGGRVEEHRAWLLPQSQISIYEQRHDPENVDVVSTAEVG